jgi:hypothetical protein
MEKFLADKQNEHSARWFRQYKKYAEDDLFFPVQFQALAKLAYAKLDLIRQMCDKAIDPRRQSGLWPRQLRCSIGFGRSTAWTAAFIN